MAVALEDRPGGQVRVETGRGIVVELGPAGGRNRHVTFRATHQNLTEPVTAWLDTEQHPAMARLVEAAGTDRFEVAYRIEVRRKDGADPATPIADVPRRQKIRDLVLVAPPGLVRDQPAPPAPATADLELGLATILAAVLRVEELLTALARRLK